MTIPNPNNLMILNYDSSVFDTIEQVKSYIMNNDCPELEIDVTKLNIMDAAKVVLLCSTYHYLKYSDGTITWIVADSEIVKMVQPMKLDNTVLKTVKKLSKVICLNQKYQSYIH